MMHKSIEMGARKILLIIIHDYAIYSTLCREFAVLVLVGLVEAAA